VRERHDTVVIGGGQAGLAMSYQLAQRGVEHVVLERGRVGERWRTERWDSLRFQFPNWALRLPGFEYAGSDPDGFAHYRDIVALIDNYAARTRPPIRESTEVVALDRSDGDGFCLTLNDGELAAHNVVVATGPFQRPMVPAIAAELPTSVAQIDPTRYRNPDELGDGAVLVVGSGASGCQIADELNRSGRTVYLSVSRHRRVPRRFRGHDVCWWLERLGRFDQTIDSFPGREWPPSVVVTGVDGGYDVDVRAMARDGVVVLGRTISVDGPTVSFAGDADAILDAADEAYAAFVALASSKTADDVGADLLDADADAGAAPPAWSGPLDTLDAIDLDAMDVHTVIWATGYTYDYGWMNVPVVDERGRPLQVRGVTAEAGLYFLGLHWMHTFRSGLLAGVGDDAAYLADVIARVGA
jgi:putative flavoprotein involved in K+ transport